MFQLDIFHRSKESCQTSQSQASNLDIERGLWDSGFHIIAGVDEAGRGPLAGPVVACACILPNHRVFPKVTDSKLLSEDERKEIYLELISSQDIVYATSVVDSHVIDKINILRSTLLAMKQAVEKLKKKPDFVLVDGKDVPPLTVPSKAIVKGDIRSQSIAAASIIAKVERDAIMDELHEIYPQYNFCDHKGYGTKAHLQALKTYGPTPSHRLSFAPLKKTSEKKEEKLTLF